MTGRSAEGWAWLDHAPDQSIDPEALAKREAEDKELARCYARAFSGPEGDVVLAHLRRLTIERCQPPDVSDGALRYLEGQRGLVALISALTDRGRRGE